jgi:hypothetical protein
MVRDVGGTGNDWGYFVGLRTGRIIRCPCDCPAPRLQLRVPPGFNSDLVCRAQAVPVILPVNSTCVPSLFDYAGVTGCTVNLKLCPFVLFSMFKTAICFFTLGSLRVSSVIISL